METGEEDTGGDPQAEAEDQATREFAGVLVADSGRIVSDAGGGLSESNIGYRVDVSFSKLDITEVERGLEYDVAMERWWRSGSGEAKLAVKPKP